MVKAASLTWKPQILKIGNLDNVTKHICNNPGLKTMTVTPDLYRALLGELQAIQPIMTVTPEGMVLMIMGVKIKYW